MKKIYGTYFMKPWRLILSTLFLFFCCGFMANAQCGVADISSPGGIVPVFTSGNPTCSGTTYHFKIDPPTPGTYPLPGGGTVTFTLSTGTCGQVAAWAVSPGVEVYQVIVKGGPNANLYNYDGTLMADGNLHTPVGPNGTYYGVSHMEFCYEFVPPLECNAEATKDVTCLGEDDGEITVNWTGGVGPFNAYLNGVLKGTNVTSPFKFTGLTAGTYNCKIVDSRFVETTCGADVTEPEFALEADWDGKILCYGETTDVTVTATGGTPPYKLYDGDTFVGDFTVNTYTVTNVGAGTYAWTVIDANKCEADVDFELIEPKELECGLALKNPDDPNTIELFVTGGTEQYTITWFFNTQKIAEDVYEVTIIGTGVVQVKVVDANDCETICDFPKETGLECKDIVINLGCDPINLPDEDMVIANAEAVYGDEYKITAMQEEGYPKNDGCDREDLWIITITDEFGIEVLCEVEYTWTISGLKIFCPKPVELDACTPVADIRAAYNAWVAGFYYEAGCDAKDNKANIPLLPQDIFCGGEISFKYEVSDECYDLDCSSTFKVLAPAPVVVIPPDDYTAEACMGLEDLMDEFDAWIAKGVARGGCNLDVDVDWEVAPAVCGSVTVVTWTASSDCEADVVETATFTVPAPAPVVVIPPDDYTAEACMELEDLMDEFDAWIAKGVVRGGCNLDVDVDWEVAPAVCGSVTVVTWTASSDCEADVIKTAKFTVPAPEEVKAFCSNMIDIPQCVTAEEIDELFAAWKDGFYYTGGCDVKDNKDELMALVWSDFIDVEKGGTVSFTYMVWDACSKDQVTCEFTVPQCVINCETAFAFGDYCFLNEGFNRWGWGNTVEPGAEITQPIYQSNPYCSGKEENLVGEATITYIDNVVTVHYSIMEGYSMDEVHVYVGCKKYPTLRNGGFTVAPGQFTHNTTGLNRVGKYTATFTNVSGPVYVIAHAVVCDIKAKTTGSGTYTKAITCSSVTPTATASKGKKKSASIEGIASTDLKVYPNPFSTKVNFEFVSARDVQARLEIFNSIGQKITTLMDRAVEGGVLNRVEYQPQSVISSVLFYRLTLGDDVINGKLLYKK